MRARAYKFYEPEFRDQAVALLERSDRSLPQVAASLGVSQGSLRAWYNQAVAKKRSKKPGAPVAAVAAASETPQQKLLRLERENAALRRENDSLKLDRDILKKAAAFFAKESE
jgi:transposase